MRIGIVLLATTLLTVGAPLAIADETAPDCEANQPWIGYARTQPVADTYNNDAGAPGGLSTCEGEHWDGQDSLDSTAGSCATATNTDPNALHVNFCGFQDPNAGSGEDPTNPLGIRVSADSGETQLYTGANIALVGRAALYVDDGTAAVYLRDNTPLNVLATAVSAPRVTQGHVSEQDCDQETYQRGAETGSAECGRDNTAITVTHELLP